jgi:hypothetical protein
VAADLLRRYRHVASAYDPRPAGVEVTITGNHIE